METMNVFTSEEISKKSTFFGVIAVSNKLHPDKVDQFETDL